MIISVTLNPLLEKRMVFSSRSLQSVNRSEYIYFTAGGKGVNVSRQLNRLNVKNISVLFSGGETGKIIKKILAEEELDSVFINIRSSNRVGTIAQFQNKSYSFFDPNNDILESEALEMKNKLRKMLTSAYIVSFSGSSQNTFTDEVIFDIIDEANREDKVTVLDTYGNSLKNAVQYSPTILHTNRSEIESSFNVNLKDDKDFADVLDFLYGKGIKMCFITDGSEKGFASKFDFKFKFIPPKIEEIDSTGSGDAFLSGIIYGFFNSFIFDDFLKIGIKLGALNAASDKVCRVSIEELNNFNPEIKVIPIGKKMKIINDSPTI